MVIFRAVCSCSGVRLYRLAAWRTLWSIIACGFHMDMKFWAALLRILRLTGLLACRSAGHHRNHPKGDDSHNLRALQHLRHTCSFASQQTLRDRTQTHAPLYREGPAAPQGSGVGGCQFRLAPR